MAKKKNPLVFMDVSIDGDPVERMVFELFYDIAPKTAENFRALCTGEKGVSTRTGKPLHYKGSFFHRILKGSTAEGGDFVNRNGTGGESIYGSNFPDESPRLKHDAPGLLSMAIANRDTLGSHFMITLKADHHLDRKHVVFGKLVQGLDILKKIEDVGDEDGRPTVTVKIINCGEYNEDGKKINKVTSETNNHEARRKGKHKKSSRDRRKRRKRYYSSESESYSDSDMESSESDSDFDSDLSSSSYISSSSDDRRKKRKRSSRKDKHRRRKRRDRRRDKRRRRRDKRSKRRSRRDSESATDSDSESKSDSSSDGESLDAQGKEQKRRDYSLKNAEVQSPLAGDRGVHSMHHKRRGEADAPENEEASLKENGERHSNGVGADSRSDRSEERQPDVMDDIPGKSRSRSMSPKRAMSKSMSISPRRSESKSPSASPERKISRSPSGSRSPRAPSRRSFSRSPARSISRSPSRSISRSPVRGLKGRSVSRSPVRSRSRRSVSESPVRSPSRSHRSRSSPRISSRRSVSRSPVRVSRRSISRSPVRSSARSLSRSSGRVPSRRGASQSPVRAPSRGNRHSYSRSPSPVRRPRSSRGLSRSVSPDVSPKRIRRGRGFSERYSYARRYRTPSRSPVRSYRYNGRSDRDRYSSHRRYSPRRYRSPPPRGRTPPRYRNRRSRTPSVSRSPRYRGRRYGRSLSRSPSPVRSHSPVEPYRSRASPRMEKCRSSSRSRSRSLSRSRSPSVESQSPRRVGKDRSRSSSQSPDGKKGLVSYGDGSPYSDQR